jgi:hypothetical protein
MRHFLKFCFVALLTAGLTSCGGSRVTVKKPAEKPPEKAPEPPPVVTPPVRVETKPILPPEAQKPAENPVAGTEKVPTVNAKPASGGGEFAEGVIGGKPVEVWLMMLDSKKKEEVQEAIGACGIGRVKKSVDKLTELAKSPDKDIASDAEFALKKINGK